MPVTPKSGEKYFWQVRVEQLPLRSQLLLLTLGVPPMPACFTITKGAGGGGV